MGQLTTPGLAMFWLIVLSPAIIYCSIVGLSELGVVGLGPLALSLLLSAMAALQALFLLGGVMYEAIFRRAHLQRVPKYMYYVLLAGVLCILAGVFYSQFG